MSGHGHSHGAVLTVPREVGRRLVIVAVVLGVATLGGLVALWPSGGVTATIDNFTTTFFDARITSVSVVPCPGIADPNDTELRCAELDVELLEGPDAGDIVALDVFDAISADFREGETVVLEYDERAADGFRYRFSDRERSSALWVLALLFAGAVVVLGRWRGVTALIGLGVSLGVLLVFTVPALVEGSDPLAVALVSAAAIAFAAIFVTHGPNAMSAVALYGTLGSLLLTALLATIFVGVAGITGLASEQAAFLQLGPAQVGLQGLVLAGIVVGALGAIDDMTVTQASAVWELRATGGRRSTRELYRSGIRIGRDHVASTVNTLVLAYAGASLPLLLFFSLTERPFGVVVNGELVATEVIRTLVGSIGLVASVPLTTLLAAWVAHRAHAPGDAPVDTPDDETPDGGHEPS